jgi:hypothetical protein
MKAAIARTYAKPEVRAAQTIQRYQGDSPDVNVLVGELREQIAVTREGDLHRQEAMLVAQAHTLDAVFHNLAQRAHGSMCGGNLLDAAERYMRLALKAQAQAVRTIEVLGNLKNPHTVAYVGQANIANGPQQINNAFTGETVNQQSKLSGATYELCQDTRAPSTPIRADQTLEAVGEIDRAEVPRRKGDSCAERL